MVKHIYPIKPCPWCKKMPKFIMYLDCETWLPHIECKINECKINPKAQYVAIRKTSKFDAKRVKEKIEKCISYWNDNNPLTAIEGIEFDFEDFVEKQKSYTALKDRV